MLQIIPIRDLKDTNSIYEKATNSNEPIFVTKNGYGALVVMSLETYESQMAASVVRQKLSEAEAQLASGAKPLDGFEQLAMLEEKYGK